MTEMFGFTRGPWWRWTAYEMRDGYICPHPTATLESYDPWAAFRADRERGATRRPYHDLLDIFNALSWREREGNSQQLVPPNHAKVLEWCSQYGLLGVLHHETLTVRFTPRWRSDVIVDPESHLAVLQAALIRIGGRWQHAGFAYGISRPGGDLDNRPVDMAMLTPQERAILVPASSIVTEWLLPTLKERAITETWGRFFPDTPEDQREVAVYPDINTDAFWAAYAEPIQDFVGAVWKLGGAIKNALSEPADELSPLEEFVAPIGLGVASEPSGQPRMSWYSPALISSLALMAMLDATRSQLLYACAVCGSLFTSDVPRARYCSVRCRNTAQKRAHRQRVNQKRAQ